MLTVNEIEEAQRTREVEEVDGVNGTLHGQIDSPEFVHRESELVLSSEQLPISTAEVRADYMEPVERSRMTLAEMWKGTEFENV